METFTEPREFVDDPGYHRARRAALEALNLELIDEPIRDLIEDFASIPQCFTLQSCYGHFLIDPGQDSHSLARLPREHDGQVDYRIAYVAFCVENSHSGKAFRDSIEQVQRLNSEHVQFGSADWFWERHRNSFALQVEPVRFKDRDRVMIEHAEALRVEQIRDRFFGKLRALVPTGRAHA